MKLVTNGRLITRNADAQGYYEHGAVAFEGTKIVEVGEEAMLRAKYPGAEIIDAKGGVIMPAFINAHTHIYSALARGLSIVGNNPTNFYEVLDGTWWAIDRHLMMDGTRASAAALYIDSIKQGVTTIFDHHASYGEIPGTLHTIAEESKRLGLRSCPESTVRSLQEESSLFQGATARRSAYRPFRRTPILSPNAKRIRTRCSRQCSAATRCSRSPIRPSTAWSRPTTAARAITSTCPRA